jgi:serine kinase of HPr protein (carbohydrate metabolism regulator)
MIVKELIEKLNLKVLADNEGIDNEITGVYVNDLLSFVMAHGDKGNVWITVQIHPNIVAVAELVDFSCILVPEGLEIEKVTMDKANQENIPILQAKEDAYTLCGRLKDLGI